MRLLVKVGGATVEQAEDRRELALAILAARRSHHEVVLVHGGGNQIRTLTRRLGIQDRYHNGLRITDADTADAVLMVLGGLVNRVLVHELERAGVRAVGLTGADGSTFAAQKHAPDGVDLGWVGEVADVQPALVETLLAAGYVPVVATTAPGVRGSGEADLFYNVNADMAAGPLARAFAADALLFLTDVPGVLDGDGNLLATLTPSMCTHLEETGVVHGGMIPKVRSALAALAEHPACQVKIAPARGADAVLAALHRNGGTRFAGDTHG